MDTDANQKTKKRRDQEKRKAEEILKNSTQQQPLFSLKDTPLAYYSVVAVLKEGEDRLVLRMKAGREMFPKYLVLKWEKAGERLEREYGLLSAFYDPCLPKVFGYLRSEQGEFLWREYVEGQTLEEENMGLMQIPAQSLQRLMSSLPISQWVLIRRWKQKRTR